MPSRFCKTPVDDSPCVIKNAFGLTSANFVSISEMVNETPGVPSSLTTLIPARLDAVFYRTNPILYHTFGNIFFGQETYIHFVAQETSIIRTLFIFCIFLSSKKIEIGDEGSIIKNM